MSIKFSIVVPCYNECENLPLILNRFAKVIKADTEIIIVNNGSTDTSAQKLAELLPLYPFAKSVRVKINQGYGYGILEGLKVSRGNYVGWTHADMQTDPKDVLVAFAIAEKAPKKVFVKGNRKGRGLFDMFFTVGMSAFEFLLLSKRLWDINAQPNLFPRSFYETWQNPPHDFSLDLYAYYLALKQGLKVQRFEVRFPPRLHGESRWNTGISAKWKFIKRTIDFSFKLKGDLR